MQIVGKISNRDSQFLAYQDRFHYLNGINILKAKVSAFVFHLYKFDLKISVPTIGFLDRTLTIVFMQPSAMFTVTVVFFIITTIVINQMMQTDVEQRTYEFAMLRTLGFNNKSFIALINIQSLIFSVPATFMGFVLMKIFVEASSIVIYMFLDMSVEINMLPRSYYLGIFVGIVMPLLSNIFPIRTAMSQTLRDSLDQSRAGID